jgi:hypothetical protein
LLDDGRMIERSASISLTNGSGSGRPKNMWLRIQIRIRNTADKHGQIHRGFTVVAWKPVENSERMRLFSLMRRFCALMIFSSCLRLCCRRSWFSTHCPFPIPVHSEEKVLKGQCQEMKIFFNGLRNQISTFCTLCADGF